MEALEQQFQKQRKQSINYVKSIEAENKDLKDKLRDLKDRSCVLMASLSMKMSRGAILKKI